jgi:hypothetical protein
MTGADIAPTLRKVAALRALCLRLPHLATPAERASLARFEGLVAAPHTATLSDVEVLVTGWRAWWRAQQHDPMRAMAERLPRDLVEHDRRLAMYRMAVNREPQPRAAIPYTG